jgi:hypothetical protein
MAATSYKQMKDLLTDDDIYRVLGIEDESDVFTEESDDFWFDTGLIQWSPVLPNVQYIQNVNCVENNNKKSYFSRMWNGVSFSQNYYSIPNPPPSISGPHCQSQKHYNCFSLH